MLRGGEEHVERNYIHSIDICTLASPEDRPPAISFVNADEFPSFSQGITHWGSTRFAFYFAQQLRGVEKPTVSKRVFTVYTIVLLRLLLAV